ncbi:MAG: host attachment protein [Granulosicoccus sp.]|nr:host attachment protein [Granulosicoccus sp.]
MLKPIVTWVLLADATQARILVRDDEDNTLRQLPDSVLHAEPAPGPSDDEGRTMSRVTGARTRLDKHSLIAPETEEFARKLVRILDEAQRDSQFDRLIICAAPAMLGTIRRLLKSDAKGRLRDTLRGEIAKNLVNVPTADLARHLEELTPA